MSLLVCQDSGPARNRAHGLNSCKKRKASKTKETCGNVNAHEKRTRSPQGSCRKVRLTGLGACSPFSGLAAEP